MTALRYTCLLLLPLAACSGKQVGGKCNQNDNCGAGQVCYESACAPLCSTDRDCGAANDCATGRICQGNVCTPGCRVDIPSISRIDGDGSPDSLPPHASGTRTDNHLRTAVRVLGTNLEGAQVFISSETSEWELNSLTSNATELTAELTANLVEGQYLLTVRNAVGADQSDVWVLQGEQGETGPGPTEQEIQSAVTAMSNLTVSDLNCTGCVSSGELAAGAIDRTAVDSYLNVFGGNYLPNPYFTQVRSNVPEGWNAEAAGAAASYSVVDVSSDGIAGPYALENGEATLVELTSTARTPIDRGALYQVVGSFRRSAEVGSVGSIALGVRLYDASMVEIAGAGDDWWFLAAEVSPGSTWQRLAATFGSGTSTPFPDEARFMDVAIRLNEDAGAPGNQFFQAQGLGLFTAAGRGCPADMVDAGAYCIDRDVNNAASWQAQANVCQQEAKMLCSLGQWIAACNARASIGMNVNVTDGPFEYVDEYWVMNYTNGNYYSAYVSAGSTACGRVSYSGWACVNATCYDTTAAGNSLASRCCKPK